MYGRGDLLGLKGYVSLTREGEGEREGWGGGRPLFEVASWWNEVCASETLDFYIRLTSLVNAYQTHRTYILGAGEYFDRLCPSE